jgi:hypothetical protein
MADQPVGMADQPVGMADQLAAAEVITLMVEQQITTLTFNSQAPLQQNRNPT